MISGLIACILAFFSAFSRHRDLALENLALRQQLAIFKRRHPRPSLRPTDRLFWVWLSKIWSGWREALIIVKPETVIAWHRQAFRFYWRWLSRRKSIGRPTVSAEVRTLIKQMAQVNPLWGAPRIHGELQNLGLEVSERTVSRLMPMRKELEAMSGASLDQAQWNAKIYAVLNEKDRALIWLERGLATGALGAFYKDDSVWDAISGDPRFGELLRRMGIPQ